MIRVAPVEVVTQAVNLPVVRAGMAPKAAPPPTRRAATTKPAAKDRGLSRRTSAFGESFRGTDIATSWGVDDPPAGGDEQV